MTGTYKGHITVIVLVLMIWTVMEYAASNYWTRMDTNDFIAPAKYPGVDLSVSAESPRCPDVKTGMMRGRWRPRILTAQEKVDIGSFLKSARHRTPKPMQRSDGKCGNVAYENVYYIRALCNPAGPTPCCYGDTCINKTPDDCKCPNCYDLRTEIHAEYSTWEPEDSRCQVKNFTAQQACVLLKGLTIAFVGNSFVRHVYTALLLLMTNYDINGAFIAGKPKAILCNGMYGFSDALCRERLKRQVTLCGGSVTVKMLEYNRALVATQFHKDFRSFLHKKKTMVLVGIGIHDHFNFKSVFNEYMYPVIDMMRKNKASWPKMIWFSNHKFGILKSPKMPTQSNSRVAAFNKRVVINQPGGSVLGNTIRYRRTPALIICQHCSATVTTSVDDETSTLQWIACFFMIVYIWVRAVWLLNTVLYKRLEGRKALVSQLQAARWKVFSNRLK